MGFKSQKPYSFGMEMEIVKSEHPRFKVLPWFRYSHNENSRIAEYITMPCEGREFMRRSCILGHMLGFEHHRGEYDERAESFHLHMGLKQEVPDYHCNRTTIKSQNEATASPMLAAAHHMSRTGIKFRNQMCRQGSIYPTAWAETSIKDLPQDHYWVRQASQGVPQREYPLWASGRGSWLNNNDIGTLELRANENPAPLIPTMLYPLITDPRFKSTAKGCGRKTPVRIATTVRERMGDSYYEMIKAAKEYWNFDLVNQSLDMFVDGATHIEVWQHADNYFRNIPKGRYNKMLEEAGL